MDVSVAQLELSKSLISSQDFSELITSETMYELVLLIWLWQV